MATPVTWLPAFQANTGTAATGSQYEPIIIGLANGNFLVAWEEGADGTIAANNGTDIVGKIYDAEGNVIKNAFPLNHSFFVDNEGDFDLAPTNDGGFIITYVDVSTNNINTDVRWERFNRNGIQIGSGVIASEASADTYPTRR